MLPLLATERAVVVVVSQVWETDASVAAAAAAAAAETGISTHFRN
jgi:hypothetical protein